MFFDSSPVGYVTLSQRGVIIEANLTLAEMLGRERTGLIESPLEEFVLPEDRPALQVHLAKVFQSSEKQECELQLRKNEGTIFYAQLESIYLKHGGGPLGQCLTAILDVSERTQVQNDLRVRDAELSAMLDSAPMLMLLVDTERRVVKSNRAAAEFAGRSLEEMVGLRAGDALRCLHSLDDPRGCGSGPSCHMCLIRNTVIDTIETGNRHRQVEWRLPFVREGQTEELAFFLYTSPVSLPQKRTVVFIEDITDVKRSEERIKTLNVALTQRAAELEALNKELEGFSYSVSHDLRAPLRSMDGFSQAIMEDYADKLDAQGQSNLANIRSASQQMARLIEDLLDLSRITRTEMHLEPVDLSGLASEVAAELKKTQPDRRVDFSIMPDLTGFGDRALLKLVFDNLLGNSFKFTGKRAEAKIEFGSTRIKGETVFFVRDNGTGFDMAYADKLFKPFQRLHSAKEFPGTGIGLASVQRIINRLGGRVWAEGERGKGAVFYFILPEY
jgi:PAS domain S-box-containing protein